MTEDNPRLDSDMQSRGITRIQAARSDIAERTTSRLPPRRGADARARDETCIRLNVRDRELPPRRVRRGR